METTKPVCEKCGGKLSFEDDVGCYLAQCNYCGHVQAESMFADTILDYLDGKREINLDQN